MKKMLIATIAMGALFVGLPPGSMSASGDVLIKPNLSKTDPATGLAPAEWLQMIGNVLDTQALRGVDGVLMVNAWPLPLQVTCDRWTLVGPNPYIKQNPTVLKPFSVTYVRTEGFDGYCKAGVIGHIGVRTTVGKLDASDGTFTNSEVITFEPQ